MQFNNNGQAIYLQIVDYVCEKVLLQVWKPDDKIPSVRELAIQLEVNPNTVARTYEFLKQQDIIYDKRGIGYFISAKGVKNTRSYRKQEFTDKEMPAVFRTMYLLGLEMDDIKASFEQFKNQNTI